MASEARTGSEMLPLERSGRSTGCAVGHCVSNPFLPNYLSDLKPVLSL